jgi:PhnB protein
MYMEDDVTRIADIEDAGLRAALDARTAALRDKDAERLTALDSSDVVVMSMAPPLIEAPGITDGLHWWFSTWDGPIDWSLDHLKVEVSGNLAVLHGLAHLQGKRTDGKTTDVWFRTTMVFARQDGEWLATHVHESVPFYMDGTDRAATDLKP